MEVTEVVVNRIEPAIVPIGEAETKVGDGKPRVDTPNHMDYQIRQNLEYFVEKLCLCQISLAYLEHCKVDKEELVTWFNTMPARRDKIG